MGAWSVSSGLIEQRCAFQRGAQVPTSPIAVASWRCSKNQQLMSKSGTMFAVDRQDVKHQRHTSAIDKMPWLGPWQWGHPSQGHGEMRLFPWLFLGTLGHSPRSFVVPQETWTQIRVCERKPDTAPEQKGEEVRSSREESLAKGKNVNGILPPTLSCDPIGALQAPTSDLLQNKHRPSESLSFPRFQVPGLISVVRALRDSNIPSLESCPGRHPDQRTPQ
ncbi:hypothetical protein VTJ04DRAFT_3476 [Mycothermus thermophilus]|uniref:uncharacterized protein n=1 Tax=Humicola insolens TaxID=85995 RepID=UPI003742CDAB